MVSCLWCRPDRCASLALHRVERHDVRHDMAETIDVLEAARRLGVAPDAVRARLRRGTIEGYRGNSGNWRIVSNDTTVSATSDTMLEPSRHDAMSPDLARLLTALVERIETDQARLIEERLIEERDIARAEAQEARADQVRMFDELRALADKHAELHADRARLQAGLERLQDERNSAVLSADQAQQEIKRQRDQANALLSQVEDLNGSLDQMRRERQAEVGRLRTELKQERIRWWHRWLRR
jgi:DNA repair exonuclease SbcCD ATPase subunit